METLFLLLIVSLTLNFFLFKWGWSERRDRRVWQQEATVLQRALRDHAGETRLAAGSANLLPVLVIGGLVLTVTLMMMWGVN